MISVLNLLRIALGLTLFAVIALGLLPVYFVRFSFREWRVTVQRFAVDFTINVMLWRGR